jgi:repressor LexA
MRGPTRKQLKALEIIRMLIRRKGESPTVREIGTELGVSSTCTVQRYVDALERHGLIRRSRGRYRSIEVIGDDAQRIQARDIVNVPVLGLITAGTPILAEQSYDEYLPMARRLIGEKEAYFLRVQGDSMINAGINDGDLVLIQRQESADNGDIVAAMIDDEATVKKLVVKDGQNILMPENPAYQPRPLPNNGKILGRVLLSVKRF